MQQNDETRFEDFVGLISGLYKEIQRIKTSEGARLGLKGSDVMCLYYLERSKDGLTGADLARMAGVTRAAVWKTIDQLRQEGRCMRRCARFSTPCARSKAAKAFASN